MKVVVYTLGCKVNQYESDSIMNALVKRGYEVSDQIEYADVYIINTCAVTAEAERKSRQCVARVRKYNPLCKIYIIGCASENNSAQFVCKENVVYVSGTAHKAKLFIFDELRGTIISPIPLSYEDDFTPLTLRERAYIKVQDGCNNFCAYCLIPYVRGRSRSRRIKSIVAEYVEIASKVNEIVLTGINISAYGEDIGTNLTELLQSISGLASCRIRLSSLEMNIISEHFLSIVSKMPEFCPHFHLSLQSGDNGVLKDMNRHYTREYFYDKVELIRKYYPKAGITTDIIVGFPTEDEESFKNTMELAKMVKFSDIHCFGYSSRTGTEAGKLKTLSADVVKSRVKALLEIANILKTNYNSQFIGRSLSVLIEEKKSGIATGYSENYIKCYTDKDCEIGSIINIIPSEIYSDGLK